MYICVCLWISRGSPLLSSIRLKPRVPFDILLWNYAQMEVVFAGVSFVYDLIFNSSPIDLFYFISWLQSIIFLMEEIIWGHSLMGILASSMLKSLMAPF